MANIKISELHLADDQRLQNADSFFHELTHAETEAVVGGKVKGNAVVGDRDGGYIFNLLNDVLNDPDIVTSTGFTEQGLTVSGGSYLLFIRQP